MSTLNRVVHIRALVESWVNEHNTKLSALTVVHRRTLVTVADATVVYSTSPLQAGRNSQAPLQFATVSPQRLFIAAAK